MKKLLFAASVVFYCTVSASSPFKGDKCIIREEFIFQPEDVVFPSCHASTVTEIREGLIAAWFGGTAESNPDVGIWISHFRSGKWTQPVEVANGIQDQTKRYPCWNPVLYNSGKKILLFYKVGPSPSLWWGELITSDNNGNTWSVPSRLPWNIYGPVKNKPILLQNGELLCPSSTENDGWKVHMESTSDNGLSWKRTTDLNDNKTRVIQPAIIMHRGGKLQILCRSTVLKILTSWSDDNGSSWSELTVTTLPNPNSGIDAVTLKDGRQFLVYNHLINGRNMLNVAVSDDGKDWKAAVLLENDLTGAEFSYPSVIQTNDGLIHITYTWNRIKIKHVIIDPGKLVTKAFNNEEWPDEN